MTPEELLYAYAIAREGALRPETLENLTGVAGEPVRAVPHLGLAALVGRVPAAEFDEGALAEGMEDLSRLERVARGHQRVVEELSAALRCVLPMRLATVYRDETGVRRMLAAGRMDFGAALDRLDGRVEWGVKVYALMEPSEPSGASGVDGPSGACGSDAGAKPSGREYLRRRGAARRARGEGVRDIHGALAGLAERARVYPPQNSRLSGASGRNVLNAAYLVRRERGGDFTSVVGELAEAGPRSGLRVELTGPWAPYSFVREDGDG
ncbi:GvpL/GvpF family gas vesicle protein [Streptomyces orinoci]|uniref:GvpL/GvpF family gas vesicle protein n=1 Tax=Streptomyces orinoci TaxID=67339 RepID=A0ABV3JVW4_STRON|nr:GvpL/GvpF family gas vesicle protein [Streptomyces orinoci]